MSISNADLLNEIRKLREDLNHKIEQAESSILSNVSQHLLRENENLKNKIKYLEKANKKNNIIIFGLEVTNERLPLPQLASFVCEKLKEFLHIQIGISDINNVYLIGKNQTKRPVIIEFISRIKKYEVLQARINLKGSRIYINNDLTTDEIKEYKILRTHLSLAKQKKLKAYIKGNKLYVNDDIYTANDLKETEQPEIFIKSKSTPPTMTPDRAVNIDEVFPTKNNLNIENNVTNFSPNIVTVPTSLIKTDSKQIQKKILRSNSNKGSKIEPVDVKKQTTLVSFKLNKGG